MSQAVDFTDADQRLAAELGTQNILNQNALTRAKTLSGSDGITLDRAILRLGLLDEEILLQILSDVMIIRHVNDLESYSLEQEKVASLTLDYCRSNSVAPILTSSGESVLLVSNPRNDALTREVWFFLGEQVEFIAASSRTIRAALSSDHKDQAVNDTETHEESLKADQDILQQGAADGPVIRFVNEIFNEAVATGASDIHFEAQEDGLRIRFRQNGILQKHPVDRSLTMTSILARVKVLANLNVSERRLPQDGRITTNIAGRKIDFRVSTVPTSFGESIVCRVLDPKALRLGWDRLGFHPEVAQQITEIIERPNGLFLVTGPTGSGKTTTLYTALSFLNREGRKILTVEDPIEYNLSGVEQVQVRDDIGMTFAKALRSFLRQDPDIIMVGEIRDAETAEIACRAALVGRLVLSTLHASTPEAALTRLVDLGVPEYIVRDVLLGVLGQKLEVIEGEARRLSAKLVTNSQQ